MSCKKCFHTYNKTNGQPFILIPCGHTLCSDCITDLQLCFICQLEIKNKILNQDLFDLLNQDLYNLLSQKEATRQKLNDMELKNKELEQNLNVKSDVIQVKLKTTQKKIDHKTEEKIKTLISERDALTNLITEQGTNLINQLHEIKSNKNQNEIKLNSIKENINSLKSIEINQLLEKIQLKIENDLKQLKGIDFESILKANDWFVKNGIINDTGIIFDKQVIYILLKLFVLFKQEIKKIRLRLISS